MNFSNLFAAEITADQILLIVLLIVMVAVVIVLPMFTNKKRQKQVTKLQDSVTLGCTVETVGGIIGEVVALRDGDACREMVIETGMEPNKSTMVFDIQAVYRVLTPIESETPAGTAEPFADAPAQEKPNVSAPAEEVKAAESAMDESAVEATAEPEPASEETAATAEEEQPEKAAKAAVTPSANSSKKTSSKKTTTKK